MLSSRRDSLDLHQEHVCDLRVACQRGGRYKSVDDKGESEPSPAGADYVTTRRLLDPDEALRRLETRLGPLHAQLRLGIEREHEAQAFGQGLSFLHLENLPLMQATIEIALRVTGTYWRGRANARKVQVRRNIVRLPNLPSAFDGFTVLHLSDLHADLSGPAMDRTAELAHGLAYDLCVLTGDYRGRTHGDCRPCLEGVARLREALRGDIYAVLGNHDSIAMVPDLEALGIRMLLNECVAIDRGRALIYLAGVDDAHFYRADNIEKAAAEIPRGYVSVLLSHTPEIYRLSQAKSAGRTRMTSRPSALGRPALRATRSRSELPCRVRAPTPYRARMSSRACSLPSSTSMRATT
jgi:uncharacterized protein